jgi:membrane protein DedA with SNARE-associated domain
MTEDPTAGARRWSVSPFQAFTLVAALAIAGAVWEESYFATSSALWAASLPTTLGIVAAAIVFFILAWSALPND